jgi:ribosomal protein S27E
LVFRAELEEEMSEHFVECRACGNGQQIEDPQSLVGADSMIKVECAQCGATIEVLYDRRDSVRLFAIIHGKYQKVAADTGQPTGQSGTIVIKDLSARGISFDVERSDEVAVGDQLEIEYLSTDREEDRVKRCVEIQRIAGTEVGARYR